MRTAAIALACLVVAVAAAAQDNTALRLKGTVKTDGGEPIAGAQIRAEAITGFQGQPFSGARVFTVTSDKKGEWSILGLTSGTWVFEARAEGRLPQVFVFPVSLSQRPPSGAFNPLLRWDLPFTLRAADGALAPLEKIARSASPDTAHATLNAIADAARSSDPAVLLAAADIAMLVRQPVRARSLYEQASQKQPADPMAMVGLGSAAMMQIDWDAALKSFWTARDSVLKNVKGAIGAAVNDLQKIARLKN